MGVRKTLLYYRIGAVLLIIHYGYGLCIFHLNVMLRLSNRSDGNGELKDKEMEEASC